MKRTAMLMVLVLGFSFAAAAHPPTDIIITFDIAKSAVMADIVHGSKDTLKHYINQITLMVNGAEMIKQKTITQTNSDGQNVMYIIPGLKTGDKIAINTDCSVFGDLTKEAVVEAPAAQKQQTKKPVVLPEAKASSKFQVK